MELKTSSAGFCEKKPYTTPSKRFQQQINTSARLQILHIKKKPVTPVRKQLKKLRNSENQNKTNISISSFKFINSVRGVHSGISSDTWRSKEKVGRFRPVIIHVLVKH